MKILSIRQMVLAAAFAVGTALAAAAAAKTLTWTGSGSDANWSTTDNWDGAAVPTTADYAIIPESSDGQPWQITIDKNTAKPADFYAAGSTVFSGGFTLNAQVNGASGHGGVLSQGKMEVTGEKTAASLSGVTKTAPMKLASDASYLASEGGSITFGYLCFDASKDISFVASNQNSKVTLSSMWTNAGGTAQPNLNENNTGLFFGAYDGGLLTLSPAMKFVTGNNPTFIADGGSIVAKSTQAMTSDAVLYVTSTNGGSVTFGSVMGSLMADSSEGSCIVFGGGTGNPTINCVGAGSVVTNTGTLTGNATVTAKDGAFVKLNTVIGDAKIDSSNGGNVYYTWKTKGNADVTCAGEGSGVTNTANMTGNIVAKATEKGFVKYGNVSGSFDLTADGEGTAMVFGSVGKAGLDSSLKVSDKAKVTTGATSGSVTLVADKGATAELTSTMATGTHSLTATDEGTLIWVKGAITGVTSIDASDKGTIKLVNAAGTTYQKITGATTIVCTNEGSTVQLAGFGNTGLNSSITATDKGTVMAGASLGNVAIAADKGAEVKLTSTMGTGNHTIACSNEDSVVWIQNTVTGNPVITCEDKGTVKLMKADNVSLIGVTGYPTVTCSGEGSSVTMGNLGATAAGVNVLKAKDGAIVTVGTTKFTIQAEASNGALLKMGSMTPSADNNSIVADNATIQFTGAMNGNKSFASVYEVKGENGLIEGVKAGLLFGSDAKTTVKLMPLRSRSSAFIKTTTSGDLNFGAGVKYVADLSDVCQDSFYGDKKYLIAESAGKLTFQAPTSVTVTGAEPEYYSASLAAEGTKLYLVVTCTKVPDGKVAVVGIDEFYATLGEAIANVQDGGLIGVMTDVAVAEKIENPEGKTVTLNLNGNTLTSAQTDCVIDNAGTLVLEGAGAIASETAGVLIINRPTGVLTIEDGTYTCAKVLENQALGEAVGTVTVATAVFNGTTDNNGSLSVKGGTFGEIANNGTLTIATGTYGTLTNNGMLSISGGAFTGNEYALYNCCTATVSSGTFDGIVACDGEVGMLEITGGAFNYQLEEKSASAEIVIAGLVGVSFNKATFAFDETDYCEDGFVTFKNGEVYIVRRATDVVITPVNANEEFGTLMVENAGAQITELGETLRGTITNVKAGFVPVVLVGGRRVDVAQDGAFEGPAVESAEVMAAYVSADAWYLDPFIRNKFTLRSTYSPIGMIMDEDETFIAQNGDPGSDNYGIAGLSAQVARTSVNPKLGYIWNRGAGTGGKHSSFRQMAVSSYHQAVFGCPWYASDHAVYVVPFDPEKEVKIIGFDWGNMEDLTAEMFWGFPIDDKIYYRSGSDGKIYRFSVVKADDEITGLRAEGFVGKGANAPIGHKVNGVPYAYTWDSGSVQVVNLTDGSVTTNVIDGSSLSSVRRTQVTGVADGTPHLVLQGDAGIAIYALAADMVHLVSSTPVVCLQTSTMGVGATSFAGTTAFDDEKTYVFCNSSGMFHIFEHKPAKLIVRGTFSDEENAEEDVLVDFGAPAEVAFNAPKGYLINSVKVNGTAVSGWMSATSYTFTNAELVGNVYVEMTVAIDPAQAVASVDGAYFLTLKSAFAAINAKQDAAAAELVILKDIVIGHKELPATYITHDFNWNLNDHTVEINGLDQYQLNIQGCVATISGGDKGTGVLTDPGYQSPFIRVISGGKLTLASGTIVNTAKNYEAATVRIQDNGSEFIMNGGTVKSAAGLKIGTAKGVALLCYNSATSIINDGEIVGSINTQNGGGTVTIPGTSRAKFEFDWTEYCSTGYMTDDSQDGTTTPYFVGPKLAITYDYGAGTAPEKANKAAFAAYAADRKFTLTKPTGDAEFEAWTASNAAITFEGDVMTIPASLSEAFTVTATYKSAPSPTWPTEWPPDADDAVKAKFDAWKAAYGVTSFAGNEAAFLLNVNPAALPAFEIESITVADDVATIVVGAGTADLKNVNGVLYVEASNDLAVWAASEIDLTAAFKDGKATFTVESGKFMKAKLGFKAPTAK